MIAVQTAKLPAVGLPRREPLAVAEPSSHHLPRPSISNRCSMMSLGRVEHQIRRKIVRSQGDQKLRC
jgi:hypothetical protein